MEKQSKKKKKSVVHSIRTNSFCQPITVDTGNRTTWRVFLMAQVQTGTCSSSLRSDCFICTLKDTVASLICDRFGFFSRTNDSLFCSTRLLNQHITAADSNLPRYVVFAVRFLTANPSSQNSSFSPTRWKLAEESLPIKNISYNHNVSSPITPPKLSLYIYINTLPQIVNRY